MLSPCSRYIFSGTGIFTWNQNDPCFLKGACYALVGGDADTYMSPPKKRCYVC